MNKYILIVIIIFLLGGIFFVSNQNKQTEDAKDTPLIQKNAPSSENDDQSVASISSRYVEYKKSILEETFEKRRVLFFYASWCPTCRPIDAEFESKKGTLPEDLVVIRVNYNDPETDQAEKDLAKKYNITYQHTFVQIDNRGEEITKWNGGGVAELLSRIE